MHNFLARFSGVLNEVDMPEVSIGGGSGVALVSAGFAWMAENSSALSLLIGFGGLFCAILGIWFKYSDNVRKEEAHESQRQIDQLHKALLETKLAASKTKP